MTASDDKVPARRRGGRARTRDAAAGGDDLRSTRSAAYRHLVNRLPRLELLSEDEVEAIHRTSLNVLKEIGIRVLHPEARDIYAAAGARVDHDTMIVKLDEDLVLDAVSHAPKDFTLHVRDRDDPYQVGGRNTVFATVGGPPNFSTLDHGRQSGTLAAFDDFVRLAQSFDVIHIMAASIEPVDVDVRLRILEQVRSQVTLTQKFPFIYARGREQVEDGFAIMRLAHGIDEDAFRERICCFTVVNSNSPLQLDLPMSQGIVDFARNGQLTILTPFTLAGAMAPVSLAGALAQQNAEALAGIALVQLTRPGAPVAYGGFTSNVDMKSGAPAFGTPEYVKAAWATGQLVRRYGLPWRSSNVNASNAVDAQAAYESQMSLWGAMMGGAQILMHGAGWLEGGLTASYEKFIVDVEMLQMMAELFQPMVCDEAELGIEAMREVGPGGHYFGAAHTLARYDTAFYPPLVSDWRNYETWHESGAEHADVRANAIWKRILRDFEPPPMDIAKREAIDDYVDRRTAEGGAEPMY